VKDVHFLQVITQVFPFIGAQYAQGEANQGPQVNHRIATAVMFAEFVNLCVAIVAARNAVVGTGGFDLLVFEHAVLEALFFESGLEKSAAAAATEVVGAIGLHVDEILFTHHGFDHIPQILGNGITVAFADDLAGILDRKLDFQVFVPFRTDLQPAFTNPFGIILVYVLDFKVVGEVEFFQSGPD
jgi:glyoxylase-like metal-dependent hydrolase (beta-lactamase superfamily II)